MNRILYILTTVMLLLTGCVKELAGDIEVHDYNMTVRLPAPPLDDEKHQEAKIKTLQLIMVQGGEVRYDHYYTDVEYAADYTYTITDKVKLLLGDYDVYVICNLDKVENTGANFPEAAIVEIPGMIYAQTDEFRIPMYGKTTCEVKADTPLSIVFDDSAPLNRLMSKITFDFKAAGDFVGMKITSISIKQFCSSVRLGVSQTNESPSAGSALEHPMPADAPLVLPAKYPATFYIPETYVDPGSPVKPYVEVSAIINNAKTGGKDLKTKYKFEIETNTPNVTDKSYVRNTQYDITATVKGYGNADDMFVKVNVLPWNIVSQNEQTGRFIALDKVTDAADRPIVDGSNLGDTGTTLKVSCNTNIGGWYTVTRDMDNKIIHKSSPTASVSSATLQTVDITIAGLSEPNYWNNYTVSIYHPTVATELVGPIVSLKFIQHWDGFIPNSILIEKGWPLFYLPPHGLQLAKRGKQVQPWGQVEAIDRAMFWGHEFVNTESTLGAGLRNMRNMVGFNNVVGAKYPAAEYCRGMGDKWFFASRYELELIASIVFENQDYILDSKYYWSSSLGSSPKYYPYFFDTQLNKINYGWTMSQFVLQVRCVREV